MATHITIQEAQAKLAELIHTLPPGHAVVITDNDQAVATLTRTEQKHAWPCKAGSAKDTEHWMAPDFDAPLEDFKGYME
jgi:antitoxin (DNA-binding transcriptional repressor) of toxin-antitoxin stability system